MGIFTPTFVRVSRNPAVPKARIPSWYESANMSIARAREKTDAFIKKHEALMAASTLVPKPALSVFNVVYGLATKPKD